MEPSFGVYFDGQSSKTDPAYFISLEDARAHKKAGTGTFINHGKAIRLHQKKAPECDQRNFLNGGTMEDSWRIMDSGGYPTWQMPPFRNPNSGVPSL